VPIAIIIAPTEAMFDIARSLAVQGQEEAVCILIEAGADLDAVDGNGWTALHHAAGAGRALVVEVRPADARRARQPCRRCAPRRPFRR
jgi:ankyrin repeat protein